LQRYLNFGPTRPTYTFFLDQIFAKHVPDSPIVSPDCRINPFLQTWSPMILSLPEPCKTILKTAHEFNVRLDALNVDNELKCSLPIWFHPAADKNLNYLNNSRPSKCLRTFHSVRTVGDLMAITTGDNLRHSRRKNCACPTCKYDRNLSCIGPYACRDEAHKLLDCLHLKWDPRCELHQPNPALTTEELLENKQAFDQKEPVIFDPNITMKLSIALGFKCCQQT
ncbi:hypothetical protein B0H10DRAFT_1795903, partial [Mycena sp. CBHHK59/15]